MTFPSLTKLATIVRPDQWNRRSGRTVILIALLTLSLTLRLIFAFQPLEDVFSWREASTAMIADNFRLNSWNIFFPETSWAGPGPSYQGREFQLYTFVAAVFDKAFGWHDWTGRLISVFCGFVTTLGIYQLTKLVWDEEHALYCAAIYAVLPGAIAIDSAYLPEATMLAFVTTSVWAYLRYWKTGGTSNITLISATLMLTLGGLVKIPGLGAGAVLVGLFALAVLARNWIVAGKLLVSGTFCLAIVAAYYGWAIYVGTHYPPFHVAGNGFLWEMGLDYFISNQFFVDRLWSIWQYWLIGAPVLASALVGLFFYSPSIKRGAFSDLGWVPIAWLLGAAAIYVTGAKEIVQNPWNFAIFFVPLAILAGRGVLWITKFEYFSGDHALLTVRTVFVAVIIIFFSTVEFVSVLKKPLAVNSRLLGENLAAIMEIGDLSVTVASDVGDPIAIYYSRHRGWTFPPSGGKQDWSVFRKDDQAAIDLLELLHKGGATYFGFTKDAKDGYGEMLIKHHTQLLAYLDNTYKVVADTETYRIYQLVSK